MKWQKIKRTLWTPKIYNPLIWIAGALMIFVAVIVVFIHSVFTMASSLVMGEYPSKNILNNVDSYINDHI